MSLSKIKKLAFDALRLPLAATANLLDQARWDVKYKNYRKRYEIDPGFGFNGEGIYFYGEGRIVCGPGSYMGRYSSIYAHPQCSVTIGRDVSISHFVKIYTANNEADQDHALKRNPDFRFHAGDVSIGDYCWIGVSVYIDPGVAIGENSVIGANSVVTREIPPHCIAGGAPARIIKYKSYLSPEQLGQLIASYGPPIK